MRSSPTAPTQRKESSCSSRTSTRGSSRRPSSERLSEEFLRSLLGWVHSGFSVHGEQTVPAEDPKGTERLARYLTRGPLPIDVVEKADGGRLRVRTPPDPRTGLVEKLLDPLELIHALATQIPDPGQHLVRYYGWYANRSRGARRAASSRSIPSFAPRAAPR